MSFHYTEFGQFGKSLEQFADLDGYIPENGDPASMFDYEEPNDFDDPNVWREFVKDAVRATNRAEEGLRRSRESSALPKTITYRGYVYKMIMRHGHRYRLAEEFSAEDKAAQKMVRKRPPSFGYHGDLPLFETWALTPFVVHRDSGLLERSNWNVISKDMERRFPDDVEVVQTNHWAVGWLDHLAVRMIDDAGHITPAGTAVLEWVQRLDDYPIADEDAWSELKSEKSYEWAIDEIKGEGFSEQQAEDIYEWLVQNDHDDLRSYEEDPEQSSIGTDAIMEAAEELDLLNEDGEPK